MLANNEVKQSFVHCEIRVQYGIGVFIADRNLISGRKLSKEKDVCRLKKGKMEKGDLMEARRKRRITAWYG